MVNYVVALSKALHLDTNSTQTQTPFSSCLAANAIWAQGWMWSAPANGLHRGVRQKILCGAQMCCPKAVYWCPPQPYQPICSCHHLCGCFSFAPGSCTANSFIESPTSPQANVWRHFFAQRGGVEMVTVIIFTNYYWAPFQKLFEAFHHMYGWECLAYTSEEENKQKRGRASTIDLGGRGE